MSDDPKIENGERCWMLDGGMITFVDIISSRTHYLDGGARSFTLYKVKKVVSGFVIDTAHRSQLYRCPSERAKLLEQVETLVHRMKEYYTELRAQASDYVPDPERDNC